MIQSIQRLKNIGLKIKEKKELMKQERKRKKKGGRRKEGRKNPE